jgi:hypothetical protein
MDAVDGRGGDEMSERYRGADSIGGDSEALGGEVASGTSEARF